MARKVFVLAATGLAGIAIVLQVVGFALPAWFVINVDEDSVHIGLWNVEMCSRQVCLSTTMEKILAEYENESKGWGSLAWREYQVEATLSFIGAFLSVGLLTAQTFVICVAKSSNWNRTNVLAYLGASASIGSALFGFIVIGRMATIILELGAESPFIRDMIGAPYSLIIFGVGCLVCLCVCTMELTLPCILRREAQPQFTHFHNTVI
ncbi:hypothetical protein CHS0354_041971 [Potamilus streckersoni]|uniref:Uncharacterized protein n=1 Tax=Potamilus streckersoni TaxID=2493646 RepID=A0AAE0T9Q4_9BIVA|nr:hypothetical protein CHS0354_041971 [Potamilus streckersoni]